MKSTKIRISHINWMTLSLVCLVLLSQVEFICSSPSPTPPKSRKAILGYKPASDPPTPPPSPSMASNQGNGYTGSGYTGSGEWNMRWGSGVSPDGNWAYRWASGSGPRGSAFGFGSGSGQFDGDGGGRGGGDGFGFGWGAGSSQAPGPNQNGYGGPFGFGFGSNIGGRGDGRFYYGSGFRGFSAQQQIPGFSGPSGGFYFGSEFGGFPAQQQWPNGQRDMGRRGGTGNARGNY